MPTKKTETDKMGLWNSVCETLPGNTTKVQQRGGFTAIDAQTQLKRATELWGPYGILWGLKNCRFQHIMDGGGKPIETTLEAIFFFPSDGCFEIATDMAYKPGNDTSKKLLTDARSKALSTLGFNSDVFEGKYDDNKYVAKMKAKEAEMTGKETVPPVADPGKMQADDLPWDEPAAPAPAPAPEPVPNVGPVTEDQLREIREYMQNGILTEERLDKTYAAYKITDVVALTRRQAGNVILSCKKLNEKG